MSRWIDSVAGSATLRALIKRSGLPLPIPVELRRPTGSYVERPLDEWVVLMAGSGELGAIVARTLVGAGARPALRDDSLRGVFSAAGVADRDLAILRDLDVLGAERLYGLVVDATAIDSISGLSAVYETLHAVVPALAPCGRVVVLARPSAHSASTTVAAVRRSLEGLVRSVAKEIGRSGATANLVVVDPGAEDRVEGVLRFLLASSSAFVSAQPLSVTASAAAPVEMPWVASLTTKVALVTGAGRGIGAATAAALSSEGAHVICVDRPEEGQLVREVAELVGGSALLADVRSAEAPEAIARHIVAVHGGVDIVVHNAGVTRDKTIGRMDAAAWDSVVDINLGAVDRITAALREGCLRDGGRIICLSSVAGIAGNVGQANYAAAKAGLIGLVEQLARELAPRGITANAVAPGFIETRMTETIPFAVREMARRLSALGQGGLPEDVAQAITFLATPGAVGITGRVLRVCGGALIGA